MDGWRIAEQKIREAIENGEFDNLPGKGKPLKIEDLSNIPEQLRMGYILLKNAGMMTEEVELKKDMMTLEDLISCCQDEEQREKLEKKLNEKILRFNNLMKKRKSSNSFALREYQNRIHQKFGR
jgi:hypothetical protein